MKLIFLLFVLKYPFAVTLATLAIFIVAITILVKKAPQGSPVPECFIDATLREAKNSLNAVKQNEPKSLSDLNDVTRKKNNLDKLDSYPCMSNFQKRLLKKLKQDYDDFFEKMNNVFDHAV